MGMVWALGTQASICGMVYVTDGSKSPYYAGLNLIILGISIFLPFTFLEDGRDVPGGHARACISRPVLQGRGLDFSAETNFSCSVSFLIFTDTICATCCYFAAKQTLR